MKCKEGDILHTYDYDDEFLILESGNASRRGRRYARGEYCIEVGVTNVQGGPPGLEHIFVDMKLKLVSLSEYPFVTLIF